MKLKFLFLFLFSLLILTNIQPTKIFASFNDTVGHEHEQVIDQLSEVGIVKGYADNTFKPSAPLARKNVVQFLGRWLQYNGYELSEDATAYARFEDLSSSASNELLQLSSLVQEEGIFTGSGGMLNGEGTMQRQHMAVVLVRAIKSIYHVDLVQEYKAASFQTAIQDIHKALDNEKKEAIIALEFAGITQTNIFNPSSTVNRGQFAAFLARTMNYFNKQDTTLETPTEDEQVQQADKEQLPTFNIPLEQANSFQIRKGAKMYASLNMRNEIASWQHENMLFPILTIKNNAIFVVTMAGEKYYINAADVLLSTENVSLKSNKVIGTVRTNNTYKIYSAAKEVLLTGTRETKIDVLGYENDSYVVATPIGEAFISTNDAAPVANKPYMMVQDAKLTKNVNGTSTVIGLMRKGHVFTNFIKSGTTYKRTYGSTTYSMIPAVVNVSATTEHEAIVKGTYPYQLTAEKTATVYSKSGKVIGSLDRGQKVTLLNKTASRGLIEFAGALGYIDLSEWLHNDIVTPTRNISHTEMTYQLQLFSLLYPEFTELTELGKSVEGRIIYGLRVGNGSNEILMDASLHAREHMTTNVLMEMIDQYSLAYVKGTTFSGLNVKSILNTTKIWFVPMMNPDGVTLVQGGSKVTTAVKKLNNGSTNVAHWKANIRGVDLNRNFEGGWAQKTSSVAPSFKNFKGYTVFSEPESKALRDFVAKHKFKTYLSYHSSGQIIYWFNFQSATNFARDKAFAQKMGHITGYSLMAPSYIPGSGASTDWFINTYKYPALTMEIAPYAGEGTVPHKYWSNVWSKNKTIGLVGAQTATGF